MKSFVSNNLALPSELLKIIFSHVEKKHDIIHSYQLVCKTWNVSARTYFDSHIKIMLHDNELENLFQDVQKFYVLGVKIKKITLASEFDEKARSVFVSIINACPNITELLFKSSQGFKQLMENNAYQAIKLPSIEEIHISNVESAPVIVKRLHLAVNFRFRDSIEHLDVYDLKYTGDLQEYETLLQVLTEFRRLKYIKVKYRIGNKDTVDLERFTETSKGLQELKLYQLDRITINSLSTNALPIPYNSLTKLKIDINSSIQINLLQYIMIKFKHISNLRLIVRNEILPDTSASISVNQAMVDFFLEGYCSQLDRVNVNFTYNNIHTIINRGKKTIIPELIGMLFQDENVISFEEIDFSDYNDDITWNYDDYIDFNDLGEEEKEEFMLLHQAEANEELYDDMWL